MSLSHWDQFFWPVFVTIGNLDAKMHQSQNWLKNLFLVSILIVYKQIEDLNNKTDYMALKIMLERM